MGKQGIPFFMSEGSFIKGSRIEVLLSGLLGFHCPVEARCLAKNKGRNHGWLEFEKHIGTIKRNIGR